MLPHLNTPQGRMNAIMSLVIALGIASSIASVTYGKDSASIPFSAQWWNAKNVNLKAKPKLLGVPGYVVIPPAPPGYNPPGYNPNLPPGYSNTAGYAAGANVCQSKVSCATNQWWMCNGMVSSTTALHDGDLIKGSMETVYFIAKNGKRYVFPTLNTYLTWYGMDGTCPVIRVVQDFVLTQLSIGGNVTYHSGTRAFKVATDSRMYLPVGSGSAKLLPAGAAQTLWGTNWQSHVDVIPDAFFVNYQINGSISANASLASLRAYQSVDTTIDAQLGL